MTEKRKNLMLLFLLVAASAVHFFVAVNLPMRVIEFAPHDDGLFMRLGEKLANFKWLGGFSQFTLMKGPGYPLFLSASSWTGLPLSATQALFHIASISVVAWSILELTKARWLGALVFVALMLHPIPFHPELHRAIRDQIYWAQSILVIALFTVVLFGSGRSQRTKLVTSLVCGFLFGWTWLTREEGMWFIPALLFALAICLYKIRADKAERTQMLKKLGIVAAAFSFVITAFFSANYMAYGSFVGVDFKEKNFSKALNFLNSVQVGPRIPFLPVPLAVREAVAKVSPEFREIQPLLAPGGAVFGWSEAGCSLYPGTCGDIAGGWFMWALRDAMAIKGYYESPRKASQKYGRIAAEIGNACETGALQCRPSFISFMPATTPGQWAALPSAIYSITANSIVFDKLPFVYRAEARNQLDSPLFQRSWAFLNFPKAIIGGGRKITIFGWYYDSRNQGWPRFSVASKATGVVSPIAVAQLDSPDIAAHFDDPGAGTNRFEATAECSDECVLHVAAPDGVVLAQDLSGRGSYSVTEGPIQLTIDSVVQNPVYAGVDAQHPPLAVALAMVLVKGLAWLYRLGMPLLVVFGGAAYLYSAVRLFRVRKLHVELILASVAWLLCCTRIALLALIEISSFPANNFQYVTPIMFLLVISSTVSIGAAGRYRAYSVTGAQRQDLDAI